MMIVILMKLSNQAYSDTKVLFFFFFFAYNPTFQLYILRVPQTIISFGFPTKCLVRKQTLVIVKKAV